MSSPFFENRYTRAASSSNLDAVPKEKPKLLTVKFSLERLAMYAAAAEVHDFAEVSEFVRQHARHSIAQARKTIGEEAFAEIVARKRQEIIERSDKKSRERQGDVSDNVSERRQMPGAGGGIVSVLDPPNEKTG